jgi:hypothetical protein
MGKASSTVATGTQPAVPLLVTDASRKVLIDMARGSFPWESVPSGVGLVMVGDSSLTVGGTSTVPAERRAQRVPQQLRRFSVQQLIRDKAPIPVFDEIVTKNASAQTSGATSTA